MKKSIKILSVGIIYYSLNSKNLNEVFYELSKYQYLQI